MSVTPTPIEIPIYQGATLVEDFERQFFPYEVEWDCDRWVKVCNRQPAPDTDMELENYAGCEAVAVLVRDIGSTDVITTLSTANGGIVLDGAWMRFRMSAAATAALQYGLSAPAWTSCVAYVYVTRPDGTVEPQYLVSFVLLQGTPRP